MLEGFKQCHLKARYIMKERRERQFHGFGLVYTARHSVERGTETPYSLANYLFRSLVCIGPPCLRILLRHQANILSIYP